LDAEMCEFGTIAGWLMSIPDWERAMLAEHCPRPVPPKARRRRRELWWALLERWAWPESRRYFVAGLRHMLGRQIERLRTGDVGAVADLEASMAPASILWAASEVGMPLEPVWAALSDDARTDLEQVLPSLLEMRQQILARREERAGWAEDSRSRAVQAEVARATRALRVRAEQAVQKSTRAQQAAESAIRERAEEMRGLRDELAAARRRIAELEAELAAARAHQAEVAREHARVVAEMAARQREAAASAEVRPPLAGQSVLVVGDEGRQSEYRRIVESLGGEAAFFSGFGNPAHFGEVAAGATVLVAVTAHMSHKVFAKARLAEEAGVPLVLVPQAGAARFRVALEQWAACPDAGRSAQPEP
jgi:hypothetical protein